MYLKVVCSMWHVLETYLIKCIYAIWLETDLIKCTTYVSHRNISTTYETYVPHMFHIETYLIKCTTYPIQTYEINIPLNVLYNDMYSLWKVWKWVNKDPIFIISPLNVLYNDMHSLWKVATYGKSASCYTRYMTWCISH